MAGLPSVPPDDDIGVSRSRKRSRRDLDDGGATQIGGLPDVPPDPGRIVCVDPRQDVGRSCQNLLRSCQESSGQDGVARSGQDGVVRTQWGIVWMA
jgi:hypothetical protein